MANLTTHREGQLDAALADTFPASDPVAVQAGQAGEAARGGAAPQALQDPRDTSDFEMMVCHADHAGHASLCLRHANGARVWVQYAPFKHRPGEPQPEECQRIQRVAAELVRSAAVFLASARRRDDQPLQPHFGPEGSDAEGPNDFGQA